MALIRIGESLHCHIPLVGQSARRWLTGDALDRESANRHFRKVIETQAEAGCEFIDVNVDNMLIEQGIGMEGARTLLEHLLSYIVSYGGGIPPCVDSSDAGLLECGLEHYGKITKGEGATPLVNSVTARRLEPLELRQRFDFAVVGMLLERVGDDAAAGFTDIAGPEVYHETAKFIFDKAREAGFAPGKIFFDPTVGPLGADMVGYTHRTFEGIKAIRGDADMEGVHITIGLSNCSEGLPRRMGVNRCYLRVAMEYGVDAAILDVVNVTEHDGVDWHILNLIRKVAAGGDMDSLMLLVDFARAYPTAPGGPPPRQALPDRFGEALATPGEPVYVMEMAPSETNIEEIYALVEEARDLPVTIGITDTPGGKRTPGPDNIGVEVARIMGRQAIVNLSCKSDDRNGLMQRVLGMYHQGMRNFFAVTGDHAPEGHNTFDLDAVTLLQGLDAMRRGIDYPSLQPRPRGPLEGLRAGAAVSPFKYMEPDLWGQYLKLWKKRQVGADYFITQVGFDVRKFQELKLYMNRAGMADVPLLGSVYHVTPRILYSLNRYPVPGMVIPWDLSKKFYGILNPKKVKSATRKMTFVELAGWQRDFCHRRVALLSDILIRGLGYRGADLAGIHAIEDARAVFAQIEEVGQRDWRENYEEYRAGDDKRDINFVPEGDGFYLFPEGDDALLEDGPIQIADRSGYSKPDKRMARFHRTYFEPGGPGYRLLRWASTGPEDGARLHLVTLLEQAAKTHMLGCEMCGDCRIPDLQYRCPEPTQGCAKKLTNGPCGGVDGNGMCEVNVDRRCYWGGVIEAALNGGGTQNLTKLQLPKDPQLQHTSSWRSEFLELVQQPLDIGQPGAMPPEKA